MQALGPGKEKVMDMKLEIVVIPVSDVDRAKQFYARLRAHGHRTIGSETALVRGVP